MKKRKRRSSIAHNKAVTKHECVNESVTLVDLVSIFNNEAYKICRNRQIAKLIALKTLQEYVEKNTKDLKIV